MTMKPITGAAAAVLTFALAACSGGSGHSSSSGPKYADPNALLAKVTAAGFQCDPQGGPATYNAAGALSLSCIHGSADETVYLDTFPSSSAKAADMRLNTSATTSYVGANWGVFTESPESVARLRQILVGG